MNFKNLIKHRITRINANKRRKNLFLIRVHSRNSMFFLLLLLPLLLLLLSCNQVKFDVREFPIERDGQVITVIKAEIAQTDEQKRMGLMKRKSLPDGEGMLFVYDRDEIMSFWMKDTLVPLSIAFISSDGRITEIRDMYPHDTNSVVSSRYVRFALEVPQGWFQRAGVKTGDVVNVFH